MLGVGAGTLLIGVPAAWLVSIHEFPGWRAFEWALLLPMAIPAYIIAYTYTGLLDYAGPVQSALRGMFGWNQRGSTGFPRSARCRAVVMLALVLYPYVYLLARTAFLDPSAAVLEVSRTLGAGPWRRFFAVSLPMARPALIAGVSLVQMEALADYGTVQYFGVGTLTTAIFRVWFGWETAPPPRNWRCWLCCSCSRSWCSPGWLSRRLARFHPAGNRQYRCQRQPLVGRIGWLAAGACLLPLLFGFLDPGGAVGGLGGADRAARDGRAVLAHAGQQRAAGIRRGGADPVAGAAAGLRPTPAPTPAGAGGGALRRRWATRCPAR